MSDETLAKTASTAYDAALEVIAAVEPRIAEATRQELADQRGVPEADRQRELRVAGRAAHDGHLVLRQVRRGHDRPPLLRRLPERRHRRVDRGRARPRAVRRAVRLCAAALRHRRQPGRLLVDPGPPRRDPGAREARREERQRAAARPTGRRCGTSSATSGCSACRSTRAATSRTASGRTSAARCSTSSSTAPTPRPSCSTTTRCGRRRRSSSRWCWSPATRRTRAG